MAVFNGLTYRFPCNPVIVKVPPSRHPIVNVVRVQTMRQRTVIITQRTEARQFACLNKTRRTNRPNRMEGLCVVEASFRNPEVVVKVINEMKSPDIMTTLVLFVWVGYNLLVFVAVVIKVSC